MTDPNKDLLADDAVPTITLAGKKWPIPVLAPRQNKKVTPLVLKVFPKLAQIRASGSLRLEAFADAVDEQGYDNLLTINYLALTRGHKDLTREEFEDMPISTLELIESIVVIARQTGILKSKASGDVPLDQTPGIPSP